MINYNPMSKEFQDECKKLGITGRQLTAKYQKEGKFVKKSKENYKYTRYTDEQLLRYLIQFYEKYGRPPTQIDFTNNPNYPSFRTYCCRFESWSKALKLVGLDVESMVKKGVIETVDQKRRFAEMIIRDHFEKSPTDLAGENKSSSCDGICPNDKNYDVKSSKLYKYIISEGYYKFVTHNKYKEEIEIYYLLGFNEDYTELMYAWRIPGEIVENDYFIVGLNGSYFAKFTVYNMKEYDITDKLRDVLIEYGYFEKIKNYRKAKEKGLTIYEYDKQLYDGCLIVE